MNDQLPWNFLVSSEENEIGQSSRNENNCDFPDSSIPNKPNSWLQTSRSLDTVTSEVDDFQDVFGFLMDLQASPVSSAQASERLPSRLGICCNPDKIRSSGTIRKPEGMVLRKCQSDATKISEESNTKKIESPKRTRSAELHNLSERKRRDRINKRFKTLQELIPNCNKSDKASVLDDAINHVKTLKNQIEMMCAGGEAVFQTPYMSPGGIQETQVPQFSQFVPIRPKFGVGLGFGSEMVSMCSPAGLPMLSVPWARLHHSFAEGVGFSQMSSPRNLAVPQIQTPFAHSQQMPYSVPGFSPAFSFPGQVESCSQSSPSSSIDHRQMQRSEACGPSVSSSTRPM